MLLVPTSPLILCYSDWAFKDGFLSFTLTIVRSKYGVSVASQLLQTATQGVRST